MNRHVCNRFFGQLAKHKKTGNIYRVHEGVVLDCTNSRDGTACVLYEKDGNIFVREAAEFSDKFIILQVEDNFEQELEDSLKKKIAAKH